MSTSSHAVSDSHNAEPIGPRSVFSEPVAIAVRSIPGTDLHRYCACGFMGTWESVTGAPNKETALFDAVLSIRAAYPISTNLRVLLKPKVLWSIHLSVPEMEKTLNVSFGISNEDYEKELSTEASRKLLATMRSAVEPPRKKTPTRQPELLPPITVATDGSVRGEFVGFGWLAENGAYGVYGFRHRDKIHGTEKVLGAELRAIDHALRRLQGHRKITVRTDSQHALDVVTDWMKGSDVMPAGYDCERNGYEEPRLVSARRRAHRLRDRVELQWVRAHNGDLLNEGADALARLASRYVRGDSMLSACEYQRRAGELAKGFASAIEAPAAAA